MSDQEIMAEKHWFGSSGKSSKGAGHPLLFGYPIHAAHFDAFPDGGGYPIGFIEWAFKMMHCRNPADVLHICSGSVRTGVRVDIREEMTPSVVADACHIPFKDSSFSYILIDPPYAESYAENLYGTGKHYPRPGPLVKEAGRVLRPDGKMGLLHFMVPMIRKPIKILGVYGVTTGSGYAIRAWTLMTRMDSGVNAIRAYAGDWEESP